MTEDKSIAMFPSHPGWSVAILCEGDQPKLIYEPIIAWDIERKELDHHPGASIRQCKYDTHLSHHVEPITIEGNMRGWSNRWGIRKPDGSIEFDCETFASERELLKAVAEEKTA